MSRSAPGKRWAQGRAHYFASDPPVRLGTAPLYRWCGMMWTGPTKARKNTHCALSNLPIKVGDEIYRPLSNGADRQLRIRREEMEKFNG